MAPSSSGPPRGEDDCGLTEDEDFRKERGWSQALVLARSGQLTAPPPRPAATQNKGKEKAHGGYRVEDGSGGQSKPFNLIVPVSQLAVAMEIDQELAYELDRAINGDVHTVKHSTKRTSQKKWKRTKSNKDDDEYKVGSKTTRTSTDNMDIDNHQPPPRLTVSRTLKKTATILTSEASPFPTPQPEITDGVPWTSMREQAKTDNNGQVFIDGPYAVLAVRSRKRKAAALYGPNKSMCYWCDMRRRAQEKKGPATKGRGEKMVTPKKKPKKSNLPQFSENEMAVARSFTVTNPREIFTSIAVLRNCGLPLSTDLQEATPASAVDVQLTALANPYSVRPHLGRAAAKAIMDMYLVEPSANFVARAGFRDLGFLDHTIRHFLAAVGLSAEPLVLPDIAAPNRLRPRQRALPSVEQIVNHAGVHRVFQEALTRELRSPQLVLGRDGLELIKGAVNTVIPARTGALRTATLELLLASPEWYREAYLNSFNVDSSTGTALLVGGTIGPTKRSGTSKTGAAAEARLAQARPIVNALRECMRKGQYEHVRGTDAKTLVQLSSIPFVSKRDKVFELHPAPKTQPQKGKQVTGKDDGGKKTKKGRGKTMADSKFRQWFYPAIVQNTPVPNIPPKGVTLAEYRCRFCNWAYHPTNSPTSNGNVIAGTNYAEWLEFSDLVSWTRQYIVQQTNGGFLLQGGIRDQSGLSKSTGEDVNGEESGYDESGDDSDKSDGDNGEGDGVPDASRGKKRTTVVTSLTERLAYSGRDIPTFTFFRNALQLATPLTSTCISE
ncbi:hypothetical protein M427DRAFT_33983 [Gonapodya prolifera JEL478]|uniref:Uncharacterized protein n=1 Tax=Gonapodya prolifera (strain JEL478) TaxID=1344416 RepID=A0A139A9B5_GONPJ|nr:hypothetical protein M427DRAFT_33983 [Gonapodya prolifera JEL478]|eukprot:KXS13390.1 hypothetical protein M427DRAFT_33983 [Gonapodya prolifera JEL478]